MAVKRGKTHSPVRARARGSQPAASASDKAPLLTFSEKELRAVLLEEFDGQGPMVRDLVKRLRRRKDDEG